MGNGDGYLGRVSRDTLSRIIRPAMKQSSSSRPGARTSPLAVAAVLTLVMAMAAAAIPPASSAQQNSAPAANPADVESIDAIMTAVYEVISGDAGVARDWDRFRSLFAPGATLNPVGRPDGTTYVRQVITPDQYAENAGPFLEENGFHEVEIHRVTEQYGVIAHAFSTYESRERATDPEPFARGINSFQLLWDGTRWSIVSIYWLQESDDHPIPAEYLPGTESPGTESPGTESPGADSPQPGQQVVLVTGATSGLGRELALRLGARGDHVIVHGRNEERGAEVVHAINAAGPGSARFYRADFASFDQVRAFARTLLADYERLDILINNAGFGSAPDERWVTEDGHEYRFQVNYLSTFLLTHMLMPRLLESVPARIVNVSSGAQTPIDFDDVMIENNFSGRRAYAQSKLAQIMFTHDLAEELEGTGIVVGSLHPATYMPTAMVRRLGATPRQTIAEGADATMQVVDSDDFESGQYFSGLRPTRANDQAYDVEAREKLKRLSEELTGIRSGRSRGPGPGGRLVGTVR